MKYFKKRAITKVNVLYRFGIKPEDFHLLRTPINQPKTCKKAYKKIYPKKSKKTIYYILVRGHEFKVHICC